jgi:hypothetical protein
MEPQAAHRARMTSETEWAASRLALCPLLAFYNDEKPLNGSVEQKPHGGITYNPALTPEPRYVRA